MTAFRSNSYKVVICGAGPAGLMAAYQLGKLTQMLDKSSLLIKKNLGRNRFSVPKPYRTIV